jgi:hypothetical protein
MLRRPDLDVADVQIGQVLVQPDGLLVLLRLFGDGRGRGGGLSHGGAGAGAGGFGGLEGARVLDFGFVFALEGGDWGVSGVGKGRRGREGERGRRRERKRGR